MSTIVATNAEASPLKNVNLLSLDAGGPQGISQLMILKEVMDLILLDSEDDPGVAMKRPCEVFHAIGGVGTGGLIAILLVVFKMTAAQALEEFTDLVGHVFKEVATDPKKQTEKLKRAIEGILGRHGVDKDAVLVPSGKPSPACKLIVPIMYKNHVGTPCVLRNYVAGHEPPTNLTIAQAMLATCATPPIFTPTSVYKDFGNFDYVGGDLGLSNPTREIIAEAHRAFGDDATVACILSIGCGHSGIKSPPSGSAVVSWINFLNRVTMDSEKTAREMAARMKHLALYHRLSVEHGLDSLKPNAWRGPESIATHTTTYLGDLEVAQRVKYCADTINHADGFTTLRQLRHSGGTKVLSPTMPPLSHHYVERKEATASVESALFNQNGTVKPGSKIIVVTGIGGCGKTQLIRKFIGQHGNKFITAFFVDGSSKGAFQRDLVRHVRSLGTAHSQSTFDESMVFLSQPLPGDERILIIDNVDDPNIDLAPLLPRWPNGTVIVTSRDRSRGQLGSFHLELDVMSQDEAVELLVKGSGKSWPPSESDQDAAIMVAKELGCHPIALVQAIGYMSATGYSTETYITRLQSYREPLLKDPATNQVDMRYKTAFAAFDASYEMLPPQAQKALHLLSFFHWQSFCLELLSSAAEDDFATDKYNYTPHGEGFERGKHCLASLFCPSGEWNPLELDSLISSLCHHSFVTVLSKEKITLVQMHPLVHEWPRSHVPGSEFEDFRDAAIRLLCCGASENKQNMMHHLYPHVQALSSAWNSLHVNDTLSFAFILHEVGLYNAAAKLREVGHEALKTQLGHDNLYTVTASASLAQTYGELGRYGDAEKLEKAVLHRRRELLGVEHPETILASANLATTYRELQRYGEAAELGKEVLLRRKEILGVDHPDSVLASACLASDYSQLGLHRNAEELQQTVLQHSRVFLGVNHPETILAATKLAYTFRQLGQYVKAEELEKDVLHRRKETLGGGHPDTIGASTNLATTYCFLGRYSEAEELQKDVLRQGRELTGVNHPETILSSECLATTYWDLGHHRESEELLTIVLRQKRALMGLDHPHTILASENLAFVYRQLGRYGEAEELDRDVLRHRTDLLGVDHPDTISASAKLATIYAAQGRYGEAEELDKDVLRRRKELLGAEHLDTISASANLAVTFRQLGRYSEAEELEKDVLRRRKDLLGTEHLDTISASANLACTYRQLGRYSEAEELEKDVLRWRKEHLGVDHPGTIWASANLAITYCKLGRYSEAEELEKDVLRRRKELLGAEHLDTISASANLACTYSQLGRYSEAEELEKDVLRRRKELLGTEHLDTISASANLACTYRQLGRYSEAEELEKDVLRRRKEHLGVDHPGTIWASANLACTYSQLGRYSEAEELEKDVLHRRKALLGTEHLDTISASANLACTFLHLGRYSEAEELDKDVLHRRKVLLGDDHPDTIFASASLAATYAALGRYGEVEDLNKDVLRRRKELLGEDHPDTILASVNLARTYADLGRYGEAEGLERVVLTQRTAILGKRHPETLRAMYSLARTCEALHRRPEAVDLATNATQMLSETLGPTHPLSLKVSNFLETLNPATPVLTRRRDLALAYVKKNLFTALFHALFTEGGLIRLICLYAVSAIVDLILR